LDGEPSWNAGGLQAPTIANDARLQSDAPVSSKFTFTTSEIQLIGEQIMVVGTTCGPGVLQSAAIQSNAGNVVMPRRKKPGRQPSDISAEIPHVLIAELFGYCSIVSLFRESPPKKTSTSSRDQIAATYSETK